MLHLKINHPMNIANKTLMSVLLYWLYNNKYSKIGSNNQINIQYFLSLEMLMAIITIINNINNTNSIMSPPIIMSLSVY
jgi:hypothetical protein